MANGYRHKQVGWVILFTTLPVGVVLLGFGAVTHQALLVGPVALVMLASAWLFGSLEVRVDSDTIEARFGPGLVKKRVALADVRAVVPVTNPWYYGWGIHLYPGGVLYNVSGPAAVELRLRDGSACRIGTDEPGALVDAILAATGPLPEATAEDAARAASKSRRASVVFVAAIAAVAIGISALIHVQSRPPVVKVDGRALSVETAFYGVDVPLADVREVTLEDRLPRVLARTNGFAMGETLRGWFRVDGLGPTKLVVDAEHPPFVMVKHANGVVIVNVPDATETRAIHQRLRDATAAR